MRIRITGTGEYRQVSLEYDILRTTTVMMVKLQITVCAEGFCLWRAEALWYPAIGADITVQGCRAEKHAERYGLWDPAVRDARSSAHEPPRVDHDSFWEVFYPAGVKADIHHTRNQNAFENSEHCVFR